MKNLLKKRKEKQSIYREGAKYLHKIQCGDSVDRQNVVCWIDKALNSPYWEVRNLAVKLIGRLDLREFIEILTTFLTDKTQKGFIRRNAADSLKMIKNPPANVLDALITALYDPYWEVRTHSALALAEVGHPDPILEEKLIQLLFKPRWEQYQTYPVWRPVSRLYNETNFEVRSAYSLALGTVLTKRSNLHLFTFLLQDDYWPVRVSAIEGYLRAIRRIGVHDNEEKSALKLLDKMLDKTCVDFIPLSPVKKAFQDACTSFSRLKPTGLSGDL